MIFDTPTSLNKVLIGYDLPTIASDGEMFFHKPSTSLMIFIDGQWVDVHGSKPVYENFSIYLPSIPNHDCAIFKTLILQDLTIDADSISISADSKFIDVEILINGVPASNVNFECKKGDCLAIMFKHDIRQSPSELIYCFRAFQK